MSEPGATHAEREAAIKARARLEYAARVMVDLVRGMEGSAGAPGHPTGHKKPARTGTLVVEVELAGGVVEEWEILARRRRPGHSTGHEKRKRSGM